MKLYYFKKILISIFSGAALLSTNISGDDKIDLKEIREQIEKLKSENNALKQENQVLRKLVFERQNAPQPPPVSSPTASSISTPLPPAAPSTPSAARVVPTKPSSAAVEYWITTSSTSNRLVPNLLTPYSPFTGVTTPTTPSIPTTPSTPTIPIIPTIPTIPNFPNHPEFCSTTSTSVTTTSGLLHQTTASNIPFIIYTNHHHLIFDLIQIENNRHILFFIKLNLPRCFFKIILKWLKL